MPQIPVLSVRCHEAMTLVAKPCALIPDLVHMCCTLVPEMLCHPSHGTDCPMWEGLATPTEILLPKIIGYLNSDLTPTHNGKQPTHDTQYQNTTQGSISDEGLRSSHIIPRHSNYQRLKAKIYLDRSRGLYS